MSLVGDGSVGWSDRKDRVLNRRERSFDVIYSGRCAHVKRVVVLNGVSSSEGRVARRAAGWDRHYTSCSGGEACPFSLPRNRARRGASASDRVSCLVANEGECWSPYHHARCADSGYVWRALQRVFFNGRFFSYRHCERIVQFKQDRFLRFFIFLGAFTLLFGYEGISNTEACGTFSVRGVAQRTVPTVLLGFFNHDRFLSNLYSAVTSVAQKVGSLLASFLRV